MTNPTKLYSLRRPCADCPFRADKIFPGLRAERIHEIADSLRAGDPFTCHKTTEFDEDGEADATTDKARACAGAIGTLENGGDPKPTLRQIARRLGFPVAELADDLPLHESLDQWVDVMTERENL